MVLENEGSIEKAKIQEVIVVEGRSDTQNLQQYFDVYTIETNGSALDKRTLAEIIKADEERGVIVFTDPDISGTKIRQEITRVLPNVKHAFLNRDEAKPMHKGSLGVEHADFSALRRALEDVYSTTDKAQQEKIPMSALLHLGLVGAGEAKKRRDYLARELHLGHVNGKQLAKRLQLFGISLSEVAACLEAREEE